MILPLERHRFLLRRFAVAALIAWAAVKFVLSVQGALAGGYDIQWDPAWALRHHISPFEIQEPRYLAMHDAFMSRFSFQGSDLEQLKVHAYPPSSLLLLWPLADMDWPQVRLDWLLLQLFATALAVEAARRLWLEGERVWDCRVILACIVATTLPWRETLHAGQTGIISLAFFLAALLSDARGRKIVAGLCLAVALFKISLVLPLAWIFVRRRSWIPLAVAASASLAMFCFVAGWVHLSPGALASEWLSAMRQFLGGQGASADLGSWAFEALGPGPGTWGAILLAVGAFTALLVMDHRAPVEELGFLALMAQVVLLFSYHRSYDHGALLFAAILAWKWRRRPLGAMLALLVGWAWWPALWSRTLLFIAAAAVLARPAQPIGRAKGVALAAGWTFMAACALYLAVHGLDFRVDRAGMSVDFVMTAGVLVQGLWIRKADH